jgi:succinate-acetate transporter protein
MEAHQASALGEAQSNGAQLAKQVLDAPEHGAGYFFPATAEGTALIAVSLAVVLGLLSIGNAKWIPTAAGGIVTPVALSVGAVGITVGGLWNFRAGSLLGGAFGGLYGTFWLSFGLLTQIDAAGLIKAAGAIDFAKALGAYLIIWAIVSFGVAIATWFVNRLLFSTQTLLAVVFLVLGLANTGNSADLSKAAGYLGIVDAALALYLGIALIVNATAPRPMMPVP